MLRVKASTYLFSLLFFIFFGFLASIWMRVWLLWGWLCDASGHLQLIRSMSFCWLLHFPPSKSLWYQAGVWSAHVAKPFHFSSLDFLLHYELLYTGWSDGLSSEELIGRLSRICCKHHISLFMTCNCSLFKHKSHWINSLSMSEMDADHWHLFFQMCFLLSARCTQKVWYDLKPSDISRDISKGLEWVQKCWHWKRETHLFFTQPLHGKRGNRAAHAFLICWRDPLHPSCKERLYEYP